MAGGTCYGINYGLETVKSSSTQTAQNQNTASPALQTVSTASALDADHLSVSDIAAEGLPSVVSVTNISVQEVENYFGRFEGRGGSPSQSQVEETASCGSGIIIYADDSDYYMVTNYHVVEGATTLSVTFADDETYEAQLCGYDENTDLAVIKVSVSDLSQDITISKISIVDIGDSDDLAGGRTGGCHRECSGVWTVSYYRCSQRRQSEYQQQQQQSGDGCQLYSDRCGYQSGKQRRGAAEYEWRIGGNQYGKDFFYRCRGNWLCHSYFTGNQFD